MLLVGACPGCQAPVKYRRRLVCNHQAGSQPGLRSDGHNVFVYHETSRPGAPLQCDFGVEVTRSFERAGEVYPTETPAGEAAIAVHPAAPALDSGIDVEHCLRNPVETVPNRDGRLT